MSEILDSASRRVGLRAATNHKLDEVTEPNLLREMFPYRAVPRITFDGTIEPLDPAPDFLITDTTFRDGQQARPPYTAGQIVDLFKMLHRLGGPRGVIRQSEFFLYSPLDREAVGKCLELGYEFPEVTGWIRTVAQDLKLVKQMELKETGILSSCSDYHIFHKLKKNRRQAMDEYLAIVRAALDLGLNIRCHLEDITRADIRGFVVPFVRQLMELREASGLRVKVRVCDTMGFGVPFPGAALPRSVPKLITILRRECGVPPECLEWHGHNDFHKVVANATAAWLYGCMYANGTLLGYGERTGNPPLEGLIIDYVSLKGETNGVDLPVITEIADYFQNVIGYRIPPNYPFVGRDFNVTRAGIHADGLLKDEEIYNIFDTTALLRRPPRVAVDKTSGSAGVAWWINTYFSLDRARQVNKQSAAVKMITQWIDEQYQDGRTTSISDEEMADAVRTYLPELFQSQINQAGRPVDRTA